MRVIVDGRQGFAYAASLEDSIVAETLEEARDNAAFGTVDEFLGLVSPDGVQPVDLDLYREELAQFPADRKVELALELERAVRPPTPASGASRRPSTATPAASRPSPPRRACGPPPAGRAARSSPRPWPAKAPRP